MMAVAGSGIKIMSDSLIPFQPAIDEPSNILPSLKKPSSTKRVGMVTCCSLPIVSVKRRSANAASFSLINFKTSAGVIATSRMLSSQSSPAEPGNFLTKSAVAGVHNSELIDSLQRKAGLAVGERVRIVGVDRPQERSRVGRLVVTTFDAQLETLGRIIAKSDRPFLQRLLGTRAGNEPVLVVQILDPDRHPPLIVERVIGVEGGAVPRRIRDTGKKRLLLAPVVAHNECQRVRRIVRGERVDQD